MAERIYLDWNATTPLRPEARAAMIAAMDSLGNPSSVHTEGRAAKALIERAREQVAALSGCEPAQVVFTSGATEAAAMALAPHAFDAPGDEHPCVAAWVTPFAARNVRQVANSETGILHGEVPSYFEDAVQAMGKVSYDFTGRDAQYAAISAHKFGGPKGVGALICRRPNSLPGWPKGGGQEMGCRAGTENVIGIAGMGAAAEAAQRDLEAGVWEDVAVLRDHWEAALRSAAPEVLIFAENAPRLPNTSGFAVPGWRAETQMMQLDLKGVAVSAGSACSSGKVEPSRGIRAMGYPEEIADCALRVSLGWMSTREEINRFIDIWITLYERQKSRAA